MAPSLRLPALSLPSGWRLLALFWGTALALAWLIAPHGGEGHLQLAPGEVAPADIRASRDLTVEDAESTTLRREEASSSLPPVYLLDRDRVQALSEGVRKSFTRARAARAQGKEAPETVLRQLAADLNLSLSPGDLAPLAGEGFSPAIEDLVLGRLLPVLEAGVTDRPELLRRAGEVVFHDPGGGRETRVTDPSGILSVGLARQRVQEGVEAATGFRRATRRAAASVAGQLVFPTLVFDASEMEKRRAAAARGVSPVLVNIRAGEVVAREGDLLSSAQVFKIRSLAKAEGRERRALSFLGLFILCALALFAFWRTFSHMEPRVAKDPRRLLLLAFILVLQALITRAGLLVASALGHRYGLPVEALTLAVPFALAPMLATALFSTGVGVLMAGSASLFSAAVAGWSLTTFIYSFVGGALVAFRVVHCQQRSALVRAGVLVGAVNAGTALVLLLRGGEGGLAEVLWAAGAAFSGGIGVALVASLALPVAESLTGAASDMKLMELTNLNQPLLREMVMRAPGTYHHSVVVGSMAEAAAEEVGASPILARVAAYYHDVGKTTKAEYFIENQEGKASRHDKLTPHMSALILLAHVREGMEMVREHGLPEVVVDIIAQHHGTRLMTFFYGKAKEQEDPAVHTVDERDFRYPGPRPRSKEAALVMLADAVEAAARTLTDTSPARIRGLVQKIFNDIFTDGQLDECDLTLQDLHLIAKSFTRTLGAIFHQRIDYPQKAGIPDGSREKRRKGQDPDLDPAAEGDTPGEMPEANGIPGIKRLGQV